MLYEGMLTEIPFKSLERQNILIAMAFLFDAITTILREQKADDERIFVRIVI